MTVLLVLLLWAALSPLAAAGLCLVFAGSRRWELRARAVADESRRLEVVPAERPVLVDLAVAS